MSPTVSIIVPSFNQGEYLEESIESAYNQSVPVHEIIVVDDGSTDNSLEIARRYEFKQLPNVESPVRVISQVNKGLPSARNTGVMNATGDYILPLDADDILLEDAVEKITQRIMETNADVVAPSFKCFGKEDREVILQMPTLEQFKEANRLGYFSAIRRSALLEVGGYNPKMRYGFEDYDLWFDLFKRGKSLTVMQDVLVMYRVKEHSMIHDANAHSEELWKQIKTNHPSLFV